MNAYLALMFASPQELPLFAKDVAEVLKQLCGNKMKRAESAGGITAIAFVSDLPRAEIRKQVLKLWRREERLWILALEGQLLIDKAIMEWVRKNTEDDPATK